MACITFGLPTRRYNLALPVPVIRLFFPKVATQLNTRPVFYSSDPRLRLQDTLLMRGLSEQ